MTKPLFVFDLDGTLVDSAPDLVGALNAALALEDLAPVGVSEVRMMVGRGARVLIQRGLASRGREISGERFDELTAAFLAHYERHIADHSTLYPDVVRVLGELEEAGHGLAVCTNKPESLSLLLLDALGLKDRFAAICGADTFSGRKPDPVHLLGTIERAGGVRELAVLIGDSPTDREAARNAAVPCVLLDYGYSDVDVRDLGAEAVISHFADVPAAAGRAFSRMAASGK